MSRRVVAKVAGVGYGDSHGVRLVSGPAVVLVPPGTPTLLLG